MGLFFRKVTQLLFSFPSCQHLQSPSHLVPFPKAPLPSRLFVLLALATYSLCKSAFLVYFLLEGQSRDLCRVSSGPHSAVSPAAPQNLSLCICNMTATKSPVWQSGCVCVNSTQLEQQPLTGTN